MVNFLMPAASPLWKKVDWSVGKFKKATRLKRYFGRGRNGQSYCRIESYDPEFLIKILRQAEDMVVVNTPIAIIGKSMDDILNF